MVKQLSNQTNKIKPALIVGGIILIAVFDLAFTRLVSLPGIHELTAEIPAVRTGDAAPQIPPDTAFETFPSTSYRAVSRPEKAAKTTSPRPERTLAALPAAEAKLIRLRPQFSPRRIDVRPIAARLNPPSDVRYLPAKYTVTTTDNIAHTRVFTAEKGRKKSFVSKALPVIKKPWDWMKAVAARFK